MKNIIHYYKDTGVIFKREKRSDDYEPEVTDPNVKTMVIDNDIHDLSGLCVNVKKKKHVLKERDELSVTVNKTTIEANGDDQCVITDIPNPSLVTIVFPEGEVVTESVEDGEVTFTTVDDGTILVTIQNGSYLPKKLEIVAEDTE